MDVAINIAGMEYGTIEPSQIEYYAAKGFSQVRLTLSWEILQKSLNGALDTAYLSTVATIAAQAKSLGMDVVLDVHNYGKYGGNLIGTPEVPTSAFADLWSKLAGAFVGQPNVIFGLMNEPQQASASDWLPMVNAAIAAIRDTGATQQVLVSGTYWDGAQSWTGTDNAAVIGTGVIDPLKNFTYEVHLYMDDTSGQNPWVVSENIGVERLIDITAWARAAGATLYLGEIGVSDDPTALIALANTMNYLQANGDVWTGVAYWGGGILPPGYMYSVEPKIGFFDAAQMNVLESYLHSTLISHTLANGTVMVETVLDGHETPSIIDIISAGGALLSRTLYDAAGIVERSLFHESDGSWLEQVFDNAGTALASVTLYNANLQRTHVTVYQADGSSVQSIYEPDGWNAVEERYFDGAGKLTTEVKHSTDGHEITTYQAERIATIEDYDPNWQFLQRITYAANGMIAQIQSVTAQNHNLIQYYDTLGRVSSSEEFSASWGFLANTRYSYSQDGSGSTIQYFDHNRTLTAVDTIDTRDGVTATQHRDASRQILSTVMQGDATANVLTGTAVIDHLYGGGGNDLLKGGTGADALHGGDGDDILYGNQDNDSLDGGAGNDQLNGGQDDDLLNGGSGDDVLEGGKGTNVVMGGDGADTASYAHAAAGVTVSLELQDQAQATGGTGVDTLSGIEHLLGSAFADTLAGDAGANILRGGYGADTLFGGEGNDTLYGNQDSDTLWGGRGDDLLYGGQGEDTLYGELGEDVLQGGLGADTLSGGAGADIFRYLLAGDSTVGAGDLIVDFETGLDRLDLSLVRTGSADAFGISNDAAYSYVDVDLGGDGTIDLHIAFVGTQSVAAADILWG